MWLLLSIVAVSLPGSAGIEDHAFLVPSSSAFQADRQRSHSFLNLTNGSSTLADVYGRSIQEGVESLLTVIQTNQSFHLDSLVLSMSNAWDAYIRGSSRLAMVSRNVTLPVSFSEYEAILSNIREQGVAGISEEHSSAASLQRSAHLFREYYNIIYVDKIFDTETFDRLKMEASRLWKSNDIEPNCNLNGRDRLGGYIHFSAGSRAEEQKNSFYSTIYGNEALRIWISAVTGTTVFPADFPIELREYGESSRGMQCHSDVQMYADLDSNFEIVVTLSNHGDCSLIWYDRTNTKHTVRPLANSISIVQPNSAVHCVSGAGGGSREMLKFIMVGQYSKHSNFWEYIGNTCDDHNPNVVSMNRRKRSPDPPRVEGNSEL